MVQEYSSIFLSDIEPAEKYIFIRWATKGFPNGDERFNFNFLANTLDDSK